MRTWLGVICIAMELASASTTGAQATITVVVRRPTGASVQRAGATAAVAPAAGTILQPGDMITASDSSLIELKCTTTGATTYRLKGPLRVLIDVPMDSLCHINLMRGQGEVLAEVPTNTTAGTIPMASSGTQYSIDVERPGDTILCTVVVFEGEITAGQQRKAVVQGERIRWKGTAVTTGRATTAEIKRSAALYARFDVAAARERGATGAESAATFERLKESHYEVLANPTDTAKRVALAKRQIQYRVDDQAAYNLKRAKVTDGAAFRRYNIDAAAIRSNPAIYIPLTTRVPSAAVATPRAGVSSGAATAVARPATSVAAVSGAAVSQPSASVGARARTRVPGAAAAAPPAPPPPAPAYEAPAPTPTPTPTIDSDIQLIASGQVDSAITNIEVRVTAGSATSRDHLALATVYETRDTVKVREHATLAMALHASDGLLKPEDLQILRALLVRAG